MMTIALQPSQLIKVKDEAGRIIRFRVSVAVDGIYCRLENESEYHGPVSYPALYAMCCGKDVSPPKRKAKQK
jgi:hypothetical protein